MRLPTMTIRPSRADTPEEARRRELFDIMFFGFVLTLSLTVFAMTWILSVVGGAGGPTSPTMPPLP